MSLFFCSDPHAFHGNIMKYCRRLDFMTEADRAAFLDLEARGGDFRTLRMSEESEDNMNRGLVANINARVGSDDTLWCLGDWVFGSGESYVKNARWFRDQIHCKTILFVWGNHDKRTIRDLFHQAYDQAEIRAGNVRITVNHYPMLTWNGQHHGSVQAPNIHLYGHVHGLYETVANANPLKYAEAWPALDVGFDAHDYQVWSLDEVLERLQPRLRAFEALKRVRRQSDPFRGRSFPESER
jgi:calcineurin-like phosphoesterase family protein